jgi:hypothetical protein
LIKRALSHCVRQGARLSPKWHKKWHNKALYVRVKKSRQIDAAFRGERPTCPASAFLLQSFRFHRPSNARSILNDGRRIQLTTVTELDFQFIEGNLSLRLPEEYRKVMCPFHVRAYVGNSDTELWDDAAALVELNQKLRSEPDWRPSLFAVGELDGATTAIDLSTAGLDVWWIDRAIQAPGTGPKNQSFVDWSSELLQQMRTGEYMDGFDPENDPPGTRTQSKPATVWTVLGSVGAIVGIAIVIALIIFFIQILLGRV